MPYHAAADKVEDAKVRRRVASTKDYVTNNLLTIHDMICERFRGFNKYLEGSKVEVKKEKMDEGIDWYKMNNAEPPHSGPTKLVWSDVLHVNTHPNWRGCDATSPGS